MSHCDQNAWNRGYRDGLNGENRPPARETARTEYASGRKAGVKAR
jgi:hypothetical protein